MPTSTVAPWRFTIHHRSLRTGRKSYLVAEGQADSKVSAATAIDGAIRRAIRQNHITVQLRYPRRWFEDRALDVRDDRKVWAWDRAAYLEWTLWQVREPAR